MISKITSLIAACCLISLPLTPAWSAITYFGSASNPADNGSLDGTSAVAITPPASIPTGCLVYMVAQVRNLSTTPTISNDGGQSWTAGNISVGGSNGIRAFWTTFDGTWDANPSVDFGGTASPSTAVMHVFCPTSGSYTWDVDVAEVVGNVSAPSAPYDATISGMTTTAASTVSLFVWGTGDDNAWAIQTAGFSNAGDAQYRNLSGSDLSISIAYKIQTSAGATGSVTNRQTTNGGDGTRTLKIAFKEVFNAPSPNRTVCSSGCTDTTIASMVSALSAGQVGEIRADSVGGSRTFTGTICLDLTNKDGSADNPITIRVREGDTVRFDCSTYGIQYNGTDYVVVDGQGGLYVGDPTDWLQSDAGRSYSQNKGVTAVSSSYIALKNATVYGGADYSGNLFDRNSHHVWIDDVHFDLHGSNNDPINVGSDRGDLVNFSARYSLIENSTFSHGGHNTLVAHGSYLVMRNITGDGYWTDKGTGYAGSRAMSLDNANNSNWSPNNVFTTEFGPALLEDSIIKRSGQSVDSQQNTATKLQGRHLIVRRNYFWDNNGVVFLGPGYWDYSGNGPGMGRLQIYNNTSYGSSSIYFSSDNGFDSATMSTANGEGDWFMNNIFQEVATGASPFNAVAVLRDDSDTPNGSYANGWKGGGWDSNIIGGPSTNKQFRLVDAATTTVGFTNTTQWPSNINRNIEATISFDNAAARTKAGFALSPSNTVGIGDAWHLTTTTDAGTDDTTLTLENPYPFTDGWAIDLSKIGGNDETGDCIAVTPFSSDSAADAVVTQIQSINYSTGAIVVFPGVTHAIGSKVWQAQKNADGNCGAVVDNRGAAQ